MNRSKLRATGFALLTGAALSATALSACGSDDKSNVATDSSTTTAAALSKADYVSQLNALCKAMGDRPEKPDPTTGAELIEQLRAEITDFEASQAKMRALQAPEADRAEIESNFLSGNDQQVVALKDGLAAAEKLSSTASIEEVEAAVEPFVEKFGEIAASQEEFATSYGLTDCVD